MPQELTFPVETDSWIIGSAIWKQQSEASLKAAKAKASPEGIVWNWSTSKGRIAIQLPRIVLDARVREWLKFQALLSQWYRERGAMSSITEMSNCPAYQAIIGMGEAAIPFILSQLRSEGLEPDQWFWALRAITGVYPGEECSGDYLKMADWWSSWGIIEGYARG